MTAIYTPAGHSADGLRKVMLERFDMPLGTGLGKLQDKVFRIGHLGDFNDLMLAGTLCGVEMGLEIAGVPHRKGGVATATGLFDGIAQSRARRSAPLRAAPRLGSGVRDAYRPIFLVRFHPAFLLLWKQMLILPPRPRMSGFVLHSCTSPE